MAYSTWEDVSTELYSISEADLNKLHKILLDMYKDLNSVCKQNNIHLIAAGGTALGAIRHKGFVPWDDDMDIFMFREEYERFKEIFDEYLSNRFYLLSPGSRQGANCFLPRIMKKDTTLLEMMDETAPYPHGIYIDINIIEFAPKNMFLFYMKALGADIRRVISYSVYWNQYKSKSLKKYMLNSKWRTYYRIRMAIGKLFSFRSAEQWFALFDGYVQGKQSTIFTIPSGRKNYAGEKITMDIIYPLRCTSFEDTEIYVFNNYDKYLSNLYGDYMKVPDINNRERHLCLMLDFEKET